MHTYLRQRTGIDHWVGSVGMGICWHDGVGDVGEAFDRPAAVAMVSGHPRDSLRCCRVWAGQSSKFRVRPGLDANPNAAVRRGLCDPGTAPCRR